MTVIEAVIWRSNFLITVHLNLQTVARSFKSELQGLRTLTLTMHREYDWLAQPIQVVAMGHMGMGLGWMSCHPWQTHTSDMGMLGFHRFATQHLPATASLPHIRYPSDLSLCFCFHFFTLAAQLLFLEPCLSQMLHIYTFTHLHIYTFTHLHIYTFTHHFL